MSLISRYGPCVGVKLWKWNNFQVELWLCPKGYKIPKHSHDLQDIELTYLFGNAHFFRKVGTRVDHFHATQMKFGRTFSLPKGTLHWFEVSDKPLVFLSREKWTTKPTSASQDFTVNN